VAAARFDRPSPPLLHQVSDVLLSSASVVLVGQPRPATPIRVTPGSTAVIRHLAHRHHYSLRVHPVGKPAASLRPVPRTRSVGAERPFIRSTLECIPRTPFRSRRAMEARRVVRSYLGRPRAAALVSVALTHPPSLGVGLMPLRAALGAQAQLMEPPRPETSNKVLVVVVEAEADTETAAPEVRVVTPPILVPVLVVQLGAPRQSTPVPGAVAGALADPARSEAVPAVLVETAEVANLRYTGGRN
jgi:hypothetical protein